MLPKYLQTRSIPSKPGIDFLNVGGILSLFIDAILPALLRGEREGVLSSSHGNVAAWAYNESEDHILISIGKGDEMLGDFYIDDIVRLTCAAIKAVETFRRAVEDKNNLNALDGFDYPDADPNLN